MRNLSKGNLGKTPDNKRKGKHYRKGGPKPHETNVSNKDSDRSPQSNDKSTLPPLKKKSRNFSKRKSFGGGNRYEDLVKKRDYHFDQYLTLRKKFYEQFHQFSEVQRVEKERELYQQLKLARKQEYYLHKNFAATHTRNSIFLQPDNDYSQKNTLTEEELNIPSPEETEDPHLTREQKERNNFSQDNEMSSGTIEDYKRLKNLP